MFEFEEMSGLWSSNRYISWTEWKGKLYFCFIRIIEETNIYGLLLLFCAHLIKNPWRGEMCRVLFFVSPLVAICSLGLNGHCILSLVLTPNDSFSPFKHSLEPIFLVPGAKAQRLRELDSILLIMGVGEINSRGFRVWVWVWAWAKLINICIKIYFCQF